jgi:hypothetical protein
MPQPSTQKIAIIGLFFILSLFILLHLFILIGLVPYQMVWGGRLTDYSQMLTYESISLIANVLMLVVVCIYAGIIKWAVSPKILKAALWVMAALFVVNTLGNFASTNTLEKLVFAPITFLLSLFCLRLAVAQPYVAQKPV